MQNSLGPVQTAEQGKGPLFHRRYFVIFDPKGRDERDFMERLKRDINAHSPQMIAKFQKTSGDRDKLCIGDEFHISLSGPWNAPVRVKAVDATSFTLETLEGHPEAGEIQFRMRKQADGQMRFEIESFARSRDSLIDLLYDKLPVVRMAQTTMWVLYCESFVRAATGEWAENLGVVTERFDEAKQAWIRE